MVEVIGSRLEVSCVAILFLVVVAPIKTISMALVAFIIAPLSSPTVAMRSGPGVALSGALALVVLR